MEYPEIGHFVAALLKEAEALIPEYLQRKADAIKAKSGIAICIIDGQGQVYGKMFGEDKVMARERYRVAWMKASQVWITGIHTGAFEKLVFNGEIDEAQFGIKRPDYIGWEGGQPIHLPDGTILAVGFSGFTSASDLEIVKRALEAGKRS